MTKSKTPVMDLETDEDGWIGGSSQSIYAPKSQPAADTHASPPPASKSATKRSPVTPARQKTAASADSKSRSLLERIDMAQTLQTPPQKSRAAAADPGQTGAGASSSTPSPSSSNPATSPFRTTPSQGIRRPGAKIPSPLPLTSPARNNPPASPHNTRTPLSASHPIPETPLKLSQRGGPQTPATPHYPAYPHPAQHGDGDAARASGLGLGLTPLKTSVPLAPSPDNVRSPLNDALHLRGRAASNTSIGSPLKQGRTDLHGEPLALGASSAAKGNGQIDAMLDRVRNTRSGLGTSASMWAPKPADAEPASTSAATTSHTIGSGFSSSNLLGVQTGLDRKRPGHRPNGLQLSLGQEISVMQELEEGAEEDYAPSTLSSATVGETFKIDAPEDDEPAGEGGWSGTVVPPTPALGCDSPSSDDEAAASKPPSRSLDAFGWGHAGKEPRKGSLFSNLPSSSTLEANWSGDDDDDDERKDDVEVFEDMQRAAKAANKDKRTAFSPLPPPPLNFAKSRTPSPTHRMLAKSPQLDASPSLPALGRGSLPVTDKPSSQRLSPVSARVQLPAPDADSDGDADAETDKPRSKNKDRKAKKSDAKKAAASKPEATSAAEAETAEEGGLEKKRSLKRDKSERIRGRRASSSKDKDVDAVKMSAAHAAPPTQHDLGADELANGLAKVELDAAKAETEAGIETMHTPVANRVQSIPEVKDDLFSSPAEPRVGLPSTQTLTETKPAEGKDEASAGEGGKTPEVSQAKSVALDWAADDDELDDELPDLDDWGVTLTPAKPVAREPEPAPAVPTGPKDRNDTKGGKGKKEDVWRRAEQPRPAKGKDGKESKELGIRIAGRAKEASLSPEPGSQPPKGPKAARAREDMPPPASTPYGRWNKPAPSTATALGAGAAGADKAKSRPRVADLGSLAKLLTPDPPLEAKKDQKPAKAEEKESVADSMHAPKRTQKKKHKK